MTELSQVTELDQVKQISYILFYLLAIPGYVCVCVYVVIANDNSRLVPKIENHNLLYNIFKQFF